MGEKPRIVIIGAGMAGLTAANKLYTSSMNSKHMFELSVVEGGSRIGGRINTSEFCGNRIELGATWIHGIVGSPVYKIAQQIQALESQQPWEWMDGLSENPTKTFVEGGFELDPSLVGSVSTLFKKLMGFAQETNTELASMASSFGQFDKERLSIGSFLKKGLDSYFDSVKEEDELKGYGNWNRNRKFLEEAVFGIYENMERTYASADDLSTLDFSSASEYIMFPGEEITIAKGYSTIIQSLASVLPPGLVQLEKIVTKIDWNPDKGLDHSNPVRINFSDGSIMLADHVIVTVSLGVLKQGVSPSSPMFNPSLPCFKTESISRLGFGVVNKLFLEMSNTHGGKISFPSLKMGFHKSDSEFICKEIPWWMRKTATLSPIYTNSSVLLSWFAGKEALELETLCDDEIINGVSTTISSLLPKEMVFESLCHGSCSEMKFKRVLKSKWGSDPLFLGSYSYVAVGSSGDDLDIMAEPLPNSGVHPLQILFAGEATHRTHYSTTHGAYFSGLREANRLLEYYNFV